MMGVCVCSLLLPCTHHLESLNNETKMCVSGSQLLVAPIVGGVVGGVVVVLVMVVMVVLLVYSCFRLGLFKSQVNVRSNMHCITESKPADDSTRFE